MKCISSRPFSMLSIPTRISEIFTCSCPALEEDGPGLVDDHHLVIVISIASLVPPKGLVVALIASSEIFTCSKAAI